MRDLKIIFFFLILLLPGAMMASPLYFVPSDRTLPDGKVLHLYISGDEFFNYLHDENGFPVAEGAEGWYYYVHQDGDSFVTTTLRVDITDPFLYPEISKVQTPSWVAQKRSERNAEMAKSYVTADDLHSAKSQGVFNNLVIYLKFLGESDFVVSRSVYDTRFNSLTESSLRNYYREVSYNTLDIVSYHYPGGATAELVYTDTYARKYFQPYSSSTNPDGYKTDDERKAREHGLLARAVQWASTGYDLPQGVDFDINDDGLFDNVAFIVKGTTDGWSDLLWPHRWVLSSSVVKIGSLRVYGYTFQFENVTVSTLSHEMFHSLGAPDLYHYDNNTVPVGPWDIMASGKGHPGAWMKYRYGGWITSIPEIKKSGTYSLKPLSREKSAYIIHTPYSTDEIFVVEYRKKEGYYEGVLPASGMIIERIDKKYEGNADGPPDEIYLFRKNGLPGYDGIVTSATFPSLSDYFSDLSSPAAFLQDGTVTGIDISGITDMGDSIVFSVYLDQPIDLQLTPVDDIEMNVSWKSGGEGEFMAAVSRDPGTIRPVEGKAYAEGDTIGDEGRICYRGSSKSFTDEDIASDEMYYYTVWAVTDRVNNLYSTTISGEKRSGIYTISTFPSAETFATIAGGLPRGWRSATGESGWIPGLSNTGPALELIPSVSGDNLMYTPGYWFVKDKKYSILFTYRNSNPEVPESLFLTGGSGRYDGDIYELTLYSDRNFRYQGDILHRVVLKATYSGAYYFAFRAGGTGQGVVLDNLEVQEVPAATRELSGSENFYPNPTNGIITIPATEETKVTVYRMDGIKLFETELEGMGRIDLSWLNRGVYIITFDSASGSSTHKLVIN